MNDVFPDAAMGAPLIVTNPPAKVEYAANRAGRRATARGLRLTAKRARKLDRILRAGVIRRGY